MGIGDRAYMRSTRPPGEPLSMTLWTLAVLFVFFVLSLIQDAAHAHFLDGLTLREESPQLWQWLTHGLLHGDFWHILGNGLVLWWTGRIVEQTYGTRVFFTVLAGGTLAGAVAWFLTGLGGAADSSIIGLSAGVYALMLVALLDKLDQQITLLLFFFLPVTLKIRWLLLLTAVGSTLAWIFTELPSRHTWASWSAVGGSSIAHSAHLGGLLFGWLAFRKLNQTTLHVQDPTEALRPSTENDEVRVIARGAYEAEGESTLRNEAKAPAALTPTQARAELDRLLDKISAGGFGSLTAGEKRRIEELSARLR